MDISPTSARARVAALSRSRTSTDPELIEARRDLAASTLSKVIQKTVESAPPLSDEQVEHLTGLLRSGGAR